LNVASRSTQILGVFQARSTGQMAFISFFLAWAGGAARLATVLIESENFTFKLQFIIAFGL
jgi:3-deoxy-D-manno-octulosonic acid (KDO) 8-phosphate synthase